MTLSGLRTRARDARGNVLIVALLVMTVLLALGIALLTQIDGQQREGARERARESSFAVAEGALNAQIFQLSARWPDKSSPAYPTSCTQGSSATADCPSAALGTSFQNVDQLKSTAWTTQVRDDSASQPNFWSDSLLSGPSYDANGDNYVWVRSTALVNGRRRTLVALVKAEQNTLNFPHHTLTAGYFQTINSGNKVIIDNDGTSNEYTPSEIVVRCTFPGGQPPANNCADYQANKGQIDPERVYSDPTQPSALSPEALDSLRAEAKTQGNYYASGCAPSLQGSQPGQTVFMESASNCTYTATTTYNSQSQPGVVVIANGSLTLGGGATFYGVLYDANLVNSNNVLVTLTGDAQVVGSIAIDGAGGMYAGSSKLNLVWDPNVFNSLNAFGTASIVQNTFREINA